jgi:galactokinase
MRDVLERVFGPGGRAVVARAPGRVNLIGEHTDYNGGFVLPMAIELGIAVAARLHAGREVRLHAADVGSTDAFSLDAPLTPSSEHAWANYPRGVLWALLRAGVELGGMELAFGGDLPQGAGLSSSAALETATALAAQALLGFELDRPRMALLCQEAENDFVGMKCGIMDQSVCLMGRAGHALFLDCRSLQREHVPLALGEQVIAICHSGVKHALVASEYNRRRAECGAGVEAVCARFPAVQALRDVTLEQLAACAPAMSAAVLRRCRHVVTEDARVLASAEALRRGDLARFGSLMNASHDSLRDDYEVSCPEVDLLVDLARAVPGVLGARITGGGFGGCTVNLAARSALEPFRREVMGEYRRRTGIAPRLWVSAAAAGASLVEAGA